MGLNAIQLSAEVSAVLRSERTKYCSMLSVWDLLVTSLMLILYLVLKGY